MFLIFMLLISKIDKKEEIPVTFCSLWLAFWTTTTSVLDSIDDKVCQNGILQIIFLQFVIYVYIVGVTW